MIAILINTLSMGIEYHEQVCVFVCIGARGRVLVCARARQMARDYSLIENWCAHNVWGEATELNT